MQNLKMHTPNRADENFRKLAELFPNAVIETINENGELVRAIDKDVLMQEINTSVVEGREERYQFTWPDKKKAVLLANSPIAMTLRPCREESVDFDNTENLYIEGDNLDVLKLLQETYLGKVKMIYIDPPYNTGNDFVYNDDFTEDTEDYLERSGQFDEDGSRLVQNTESNGRFHTDWLNMIYPRLKLAKDLLSDDGVIFISIDDNEQDNLKKICDEVFGESQFIGKIAVVNNLKGRNDKKDIATCHEYMMIYGKSEFSAGGMPLTEEQRKSFDKIDQNGNAYQLRDLRKRGRPDRREDRPNMYFPIYYNEETKECSLEKHEGWIEILPLRGDNTDGRWRWGKERVQANLSILEAKYSAIAGKWGIQHRVYLNPALNPVISGECDEDEPAEERASKSKSFWMGGELSSDVGRRQLKNLFETAYFDYPKSVDLILNTLYMGADSDSIILDFFSGSATTAHAVMQLNAEDGGHRKFIMVQLPEPTDEKSEAYKAGYKNICEIGKERIRRAGKKIKDALNSDGYIIRKRAEYEKENGTAKGFSGAVWGEDEKNKDIADDFDCGFRVLKLDSTNMKDVYYHPDEIEQSTFDDLVDNVKDDRTPEDLLFQVMLDLGVLLSSKIEVTEIAGKTVYNVADNYLIACFDDDVSEDVVTAAAKLKPYYFVMRDSSMADDNVATNFEQIFEQYSKETVRRVI